MPSQAGEQSIPQIQLNSTEFCDFSLANALYRFSHYLVIGIVLCD